MTALTLQVPACGSTGRLSNSSLGDNDMGGANSSCASSQGGSERGFAMPKISIVSLGEDTNNNANDARTTGDSRSAASYDASSSARGGYMGAISVSSLSQGPSEGASKANRGIRVVHMTMEDTDEEVKGPAVVSSLNV